MHCSSVSIVTVVLSPSRCPFKTTISSVPSAVRASPFANAASIFNISSVISTVWLPKPRGSLIARFISSTSSSSESACKTNTLQRDKSAAFTSNEGFSVVAPISTMLPFSTNGKNASCCALLKRWISSINSSVRSPMRWFCSASLITLRISLMPLVTALKLMKFAFVRAAMICASVVLPTPGGPQKIMEDTRSSSISCRSTLPLPSKWRCPANSSSVRGRIRVASGMSCPARFPNKLCCSISRLLPSAKPA